MGPKIKSKASVANNDDVIQAELARLEAEVARLSTIEELVKSLSGISQLIQDRSDSITTALSTDISTVLPYIKGSELQLGLVSKNL